MKTNLKNLALGLVFASAISPAFVACNSSEEIPNYLPSSASVRSFSLASNRSVLPNLDSVYFSIDLYSGAIFNADSLPYGTKTNALVPIILTDGSSVAELHVPRPNTTDTVINYLENSTDSVDFSNGPVKLRIISLDGKTERNYSISVNVHKLPTDTLTWSRLEGQNLPTVFNAVSEQHTTEAGGTFYCVTRYENRYSIAVTTDPAGSWDAQEVTLPANPRLNTLTATTEGIYILDKDSKVYKSTDNGKTWTATDVEMDFAIGGYGDKLLGTRKIGSDWKIVQYPGEMTWSLPAGFPVRGASVPMSYRFEMSLTPQMLIIGGRDANDEYLNKTWAFDGSQWADITRGAIPEALEGMNLVPYFNIHTDTTAWHVATRNSVLLAFGGQRADGTINDTVYMSTNFGMHWTKAPENLQIPTTIVPPRTDSQAFTVTTTVKSTGRATAPITEWEVPYIYLFGGVNTEGQTYNTIYRGAIKQFTFKPLQ